MSTTVLDIVQEVCRRTAQTVPGALTTSNDPGVVQYLGLLNEVGAEISERWSWQELHKRVFWPAPGTESQGTIAARFGSGIEQILGGTLWDATDQKILRGSLSYLDVQVLINFTHLGVTPEYWFQQGELFIAPAPSIGNSMNAFIRVNTWVVQPGGPRASRITNDGDTTVFDFELMVLGLKARWKRTKGLAYAEDLRDFEARAANKAAQDRVHPVLDLDTSPRGRFVPNVPVVP